VYRYGQDEGCYNASLINFPVRYNSNNGAHWTKSNAVSVENITRKKIYEIPQTWWKALDIYNAIAQFCNSHE